ncbi:MAG: MoxR family ATPase [Thermoplasmata archaeon]
MVHIPRAGSRPSNGEASDIHGPEARTLLLRLKEGIHRVVVGRDEVLDQILVGLVADGHLLIEDLPGLGKTLMARSFAQALGLKFTRIQFTADLLPQDITGGEVFDVSKNSFSFRPGPVFTNLLLADEINRAPPKVQSALLEAMQEYQVTSEGGTHPLSRPFIVLATQNPLELEGTYPLPEAQVDRFLMRLTVGYPTVTEERAILDRRRERRTDMVEVPQVLAPEDLVNIQGAAEEVEIDPALERYIVDLVGLTRADPRVEVGASPRGSLALLKLSRARALMEGRDFVVPDDVKSLAGPALAHRIIVRPEPWIRGVRGIQVVAAASERLTVPKVG